MFRPMALTVIFALVASLVLTLVLMPVLATFALRGPVSRTRQLGHRQRSAAPMPPLLERSERHPVPAIGIALALLVGSGVLATRLGAEFIPAPRRGRAGRHHHQAAEHRPLDRRRDHDAGGEDAAALPRGEDRGQPVRRPEIATDPMGVEQSDSFIMLTPREAWTTAPDREGLVAALCRRRSTARCRRPAASWSQPIEMRMQELLQGVRVRRRHQSSTATTWRRCGARRRRRCRRVARVPGAADVKAEQTAGLPYLRVIIDREAVARYGLNASRRAGRGRGARRHGRRHAGRGQCAGSPIRVRLRPE